jgi:hypothetical protein
MAAVTLPNVGIVAGFAPGEDGWDNEMSANLRLLDALVQPVVVDKDLTAPPGSPTGGQLYIVGASSSGDWASHETHLAVWQAGDDLTAAWKFVTPKEGWEVWIVDEDKAYRFDGTAWAEIAAGGGGGGASVPPVVEITDSSFGATSANSGNYSRFTNSSTKSYTFNSSDTFELNAEYHGRNVGAGDLTLLPVGSFVLNAPRGGSLVVKQGATFTVKIVDTAEADVFGQTEAP